MELKDLSPTQLAFSKAGILKDPNWESLEERLTIEQQVQCIQALCHDNEPLRTIDHLLSPQMVKSVIKERN